MLVIFECECCGVMMLVFSWVFRFDVGWYNIASCGFVAFAGFCFGCLWWVLTGRVGFGVFMGFLA